MDESSPPPPFSPFGPEGQQTIQNMQGQAGVAAATTAAFNSPIQSSPGMSRFGPTNIRRVEVNMQQQQIQPGAGLQSPQDMSRSGMGGGPGGSMGAGGIGRPAGGPGFNPQQQQQQQQQQLQQLPPQQQQLAPDALRQVQQLQAMRRAEVHKIQQQQQLQRMRQQQQFAVNPRKTESALMQQQQQQAMPGRPLMNPRARAQQRPPLARPPSASQVASVHTFRLPDAIDAGGMSFPPVKDAGPVSNEPNGLLPFSCHCPGPHGDSEAMFPPLTEQDSMRVMELLPGQPGDPIKCQLHATNLREAACRYSALSYPWDGDTPDLTNAQIMCNSRHVAVKGNLYMALVRLRRQAVPVILWVDALCINQQDIAEKSNQVRRMSQIFQNACQVFVWLGPENMGHFHTPTALSGLCSIVNTWRQSQHKPNLPDVGYSVDPEQQDSMEEAPEELPPLANPDTFRLFLRSWFHRAWVIQEVALARSAKLLLGKYELPWDLVGLGASILRTNMDKINFQGLESCQTGILNAYFMYRVSRCQRYFDPLEFSFHQLLKLTRGFLCKDPKDRIYGILAIPTLTENTAAGEESGPFVIPDYSKTVEEAYRDVALKIINTTRALDILSSVQHDVSRTLDSTWVPDWQAILTMTLAPWTPSLDFNPAHGRVLEILTGKHRDHRHLTVRGIVADQISWISEPGLQTVSNAPPGMGPHPLLVRLATQPMDVVAEACMVLTSGKDWYGVPVSDRVIHQRDFLKMMLETRTTLDTFWDMGHVRPPPQQQVPTPNKDQIMDFGRQVNSGDQTRFLKAAESVADARRRFTTTSGRLGLGPLGMQVGDKVCILFGASVPFVLRKRQNGYSLIGECFVDKLMHGEALKDHGKEKGHEEWITLE
ncbi:hypothetical protein MKZ38_003234 [Zalerion maritima]|uniref:Heterokaryon incompatibility domain-containing protein n=1 Tax=Zalerion maritima TaxID=339359 RepID=A0AAD5WVM6_9PEZI|nr:hypothetical protein MKZ38_003234 [Zalerion maritima]